MPGWLYYCFSATPSRGRAALPRSCPNSFALATEGMAAAKRPNANSSEVDFMAGNNPSLGTHTPHADTKQPPHAHPQRTRKEPVNVC